MIKKSKAFTERLDTILATMLWDAFERGSTDRSMGMSIYKKDKDLILALVADEIETAEFIVRTGRERMEADGTYSLEAFIEDSEHYLATQRKKLGI
jgi:hypothetical protein